MKQQQLAIKERTVTLKTKYDDETKKNCFRVINDLRVFHVWYGGGMGDIASHTIKTFA